MSQRLIELFVYSQQKQTKDGKKFIKYSTKALFKMRNKDGTLSKEKAPHFINIAFTDDAFESSKVKKNDIKRGILKVDASKVGLPEVYEITIDAKTDKKVYPRCWIRGGIESFTPVVKEHQFDFVLEEDTNEIDTDDENE